MKMAQSPMANLFSAKMKPNTLSLEVKDMSLQSTGEDYFEALSKIREELAAFKAVPVCYGASRNVFPSRHSRRFERGLKAYKMSKGNTAKTGDLVYIFDSGEDVDGNSRRATGLLPRVALSLEQNEPLTTDSGSARAAIKRSGDAAVAAIVVTWNRLACLQEALQALFLQADSDETGGKVARV